MLKALRLGALACALAFASTAMAQDSGDEEVVVTGARASLRNAVYAEVPIPAISMTRRADFVIVDATVSSDSREPEVRRAEIERTLQDMMRRARESEVTLALQQDDVVRPFSMNLAMRLLSAGRRPDTSQVVVQLRTAVRDDDTLDTARQRFTRFIGGVEGSGRGLAEISSDIGLTLRDIPQYREPLIAAIVADARAISQALGPTYRAELTGLQNPVAWRKSGDLQMTMFISYQLGIVSADVGA